jgi:radial spoke head protein 1
MADDEEGGPKYTFQTENGETKSMSRGYTGKAVASYPNGDVYDGDFLDGIREGRGTYRYGRNGDIYHGEWIKNLKHGIGKMIYNMQGPPKEGDEDKKPEVKVGEYQGYWENGRRHGEGVFTYPNGDVYSGWWRFGEKEGTGSYISKATGMKMLGEWKNGEISHGRWVYPNGVYFEGKFENNKPSGAGTWHFTNSNSLQGVYTQKPKVLGDDEEPAEEEEGVAAKKKFDLVWQANTNISQSAYLVNSVEQ